MWRITRYPPKSALTFHTNQVVAWEPLARQGLRYPADLAARNSHMTSFHHGHGAESVHTTSRLKHLKSSCASLAYFSPFCCLEWSWEEWPWKKIHWRQQSHSQSGSLNDWGQQCHLSYRNSCSHEREIKIKSLNVSGLFVIATSTAPTKTSRK